MYFSNTIKQTNYFTNIQLVLLFYRCILISRCDNQVNNVKKKVFLYLCLRLLKEIVTTGIISVPLNLKKLWRSSIGPVFYDFTL